MENSEYNPYVLVSFEKQNDNNYILGILPINYDENYYYEIHIKTEYPYVNNIKESIGSYIYVDLISKNLMEIYTGEYYEESCSDGDFEYISYDYKKTEKENKISWKPKFLYLKSEFKKLFDSKLKPYELTRRMVIDNYRSVYLEEIEKCSKEEIDKLNKGSFWHSIYQLFEYNPSWDSFNKLIDPNYQYYPPTQKDWEVEYLELEKIYNHLKVIETENYAVIKVHMVELYKRAFNRMLPNLKYNNKEIDENIFIDFFNVIMGKLNQKEN
ncbi:hypothetical protein E0I26_14370 [Flavobacterium rhamnosiphilum]|uniref:Uncharacterized protein n=1 Tax=Flavobacterium rhamnosiphilum TaxID=2541724 RepID=A0A4R5F4D7_9FLAO|nr:hypothetical protein [Flavobacterium rhamnosiphilum]TDE42084.1 hypothetical protein E0I26_14370 [Flavobacterium rhamnosiphilum]